MVVTQTHRPSIATNERWELYKLLSEQTRLKLLTLCATEELTISELAELLVESQPNVSRHTAALKRIGLVDVRKQGTRVLAKFHENFRADAVVRDALEAGFTLCTADGSLGRLPALIQARDAESRAYFEEVTAASESDDALCYPTETPAYLAALSLMIENRGLAVDAGTGDGRLLDVIAPVYKRVVAVDRSKKQLSLAQARLVKRQYTHVTLLESDIESDALVAQVDHMGGADAVFVSRMLHHAPKPIETLQSLARLCKKGGDVIAIDYESHNDEALQKSQADIWLGFSKNELTNLALRAGLVNVSVIDIPAPYRGSGRDHHINWHAIRGTRE